MTQESSNSTLRDFYYLPKRWYTLGHKFWLLGHVFKHKGKIILITLTSIIAILLQTIIPFILGYVFETAIPMKDSEFIIAAGVVTIVLGILRFSTNAIAAGANEIIAQNVEMQIRVEFYENLEHKSMSFHDSSRIGDLMQMATGDTRRINASVSPGVRMTVTTVFTVIVTWIAMWIASPSLSLVFIITLPFYLYTLYTFGKKLHPLSVKRQAIVAQMNAELQENLTGVRVVRTFSVQDREVEKFQKTIDDLEEILRTRGIASAYYIPSLILGVTNAAIFLVAAYLIEATMLNPLLFSIWGVTITIQSIGIGELITFLSLTGFLSIPTMFLRWILDMTLLGFAGADRIYSVISKESLLSEGIYNPKKCEGLIEFKCVSFSYSTDSPEVLKDIELTINPGETLAIIGPTGCGKTTLSKLIYRLYDVSRGSILIDGFNVNDWNLTALRRVVGVIEQDPYLFSTSIKANIAYGKDNPSNEEIIAAAVSAQAHDFIENFSDGYDTLVGERGITLSGGQKQRIAMARGFLADPAILIMDDATSAVDAETEARIQKAIKKLLKDRTAIIITHRLSTLQAADKIAFMEKGEIKTIGTHQELIKTFEPYRRIFKPYISLPPLEIQNVTGSI